MHTTGQNPHVEGDTSISEPKRSERLCFIDSARAIAITMMLQGHFIGVTLAADARDLANPYYLAHSHLRSYTAPLFLVVSGLVFVFFLDGARDDERPAMRVRRGLRRGLMLIALGHLLRLNLPVLYTDPRHALSLFLTVHVLQVVGVGLLSLIAAQAAQRFVRLPRSLWFGLLGLGTFALTPLARSQDYSAWPRLLQNYLITDHGSVFTLFPSLGYMFFGGACGALTRAAIDAQPGGRPSFEGRNAASGVQGATRSMRKRAYRGLDATLPLAWMGAGAALFWGAAPAVYSLVNACPASLDCTPFTPAHVWLARLGAIVSALGALMLVEPLLRRHVPHVFLRTGQQTLFVFVTHAIILYGTVVGSGLDNLLHQALTPMQATLGAILFIAFHMLLVQMRANQQAASHEDLAARARLRPAAPG